MRELVSRAIERFLQSESAYTVESDLLPPGAMLRDAAPGHVRAVRRLFFDILSPDDLRTLERITATVLDLVEADAAAFSADAGDTAYPRMP